MCNVGLWLRVCVWGVDVCGGFLCVCAVCVCGGVSVCVLYDVRACFLCVCVVRLVCLRV